MHPADVGKLLSHLVSNNILVPIGQGRWSSYTINTNYTQRKNQQRTELNQSSLTTDEMIYSFIQKQGSITTRQVTQITSIKTLAGAGIALKRLIKSGQIQRIHKDGQNLYIIAPNAETQTL